MPKTILFNNELDKALNIDVYGCSKEKPLVHYKLTPSPIVVAANTNYGLRFASVVARKNVFATQFHPEKSGRPGAIVIMNFVNIVRC